MMSRFLTTLSLTLVLAASALVATAPAMAAPPRATLVFAFHPL